MADFPFSSSPGSEEDACVDSIVAQAMDICALEQIAALNTSHLSDSALPTDLETRFRKLKSFPGANPKPKVPPSSLNPEKETIPRSLNQFNEVPTSVPTVTNKETDSMKPKILSQKSEVKSPKKGKQSPSSDKENQISPPAKALKPKEGAGYVSSPSFSSGSDREASSPPKLACCFWCSPKKGSRKKNKENGVMNFDLKWEDIDDIPPYLSTASMKKQQRKLKKALKEQEKVTKEAEKMVKWVKQASARMNVSAMDYSPSDDEVFK